MDVLVGGGVSAAAIPAPISVAHHGNASDDETNFALCLDSSWMWSCEGLSFW